MVDEDNKFLSQYIEKSKGNMERILRDIDKFPSDRMYIIYFDLAFDAETIAVHTLLLGNRDEALKWFKDSSKYYYLQVESQRTLKGTCSWEWEMGRCNDALDMAILSGDNELIGRCATLSLSICKEYPKKFRAPANDYYRLTSLANFVKGKPELARSVLNNMSTKSKSLDNLFLGRKESLSGLIAGSRPELIAGLKKLLTYKAKKKRTKLPYDLISIDATVMLKIARGIGIIIDPGDFNKGLEKYVPWNLFE